MKLITPAPFNVYTFNELTKDAQQVAYDGLKDLIVDDRLRAFEDDCYEVLSNVYNLLGVKQVSYDLSFSQGDGVSFTCDNFNNVTINDDIFNDESISQAVKNNIKQLGDHLTVKTVINQGKYAYAHSNQVTIHLDGFNDDIVSKLLPDYMADQIQEAYAKYYLKLCQQLKDNGYALYEVTLEDVQDLAESNDYEFYEDGRQF